MTAYAFPEKGGKQWNIGSRTICFFMNINEIGTITAALYEDQRDTGLVRFGLVREWSDTSAFVADCLAAGGMGHMMVEQLLPAAHKLMDSFLKSTMPTESNSTPPTMEDMNYVIAEFVEMIPPGAGQIAPQLVANWLVPTGVSPYPSSVTPAPPRSV